MKLRNLTLGFCLFCGLSAVAVMLRAQAPVANIAPLTNANGVVGKVTLTQPATGSTITIVDGKTFTVNNTISLTGTDAQTYTFPTTSATMARTDAGQTFTGTQAFGAVTGTTFNKLTLTTPATGSTITVIDGKTLTFNNTMTFSGTDAQTYTFPTTTATIARTDATNTFTGTQNFSGAIVGSSDINAGISGAIYWGSRAQMTSPADGVVLFRNLAATAGALLKPAAIQSAGTKFTVGAAGCGTISATTGGATAGSFATTLTGACAAVVTFGDPSTTTATNGWSCAVNDQTTGNLIRQTASTTTTATFTGTTVASDVINFHCFAY